MRITNLHRNIHTATRTRFIPCKVTSRRGHAWSRFKRQSACHDHKLQKITATLTRARSAVQFKCSLFGYNVCIMIMIEHIGSYHPEIRMYSRWNHCHWSRQLLEFVQCKERLSWQNTSHPITTSYVMSLSMYHFISSCKFCIHKWQYITNLHHNHTYHQIQNQLYSLKSYFQTW